MIAPDETCNARKRNHSGTEKSGASHKNTKRSPYCGRPAGWGTDHPGVGRCKLHGGNVPNHRLNAQEELARRGVEAFGLPVNIEPQEALLEELRRTAGIILFYEEQIRGLPNPEDFHGPTGTAGEAADTDLTHHPTEQANIWLKLHQQERGHYIKVAETCIRAGIEERRVQIAEREGAVLAMVIKGVLTDVGVALTDNKVRETIRTWLMKAGSLEPPAIEAKAVPVPAQKEQKNNGKT